VDLAAGVCGVTLVASETSPWRPQQWQLFAPAEPGDDERLGDLLDRLVNRLGAQAVVRPQIVDDYQPELACHFVSVADSGVRAMPEAGGPAMSADRAKNPRPVRLFARPVLVRVIALLPDGPPTWFRYRGREYRVAAAEGPERLETAWWRGPDVRRDYFRVTTQTGEQFWMFHALDEHQWYVHGAFA
jgi:protein ImuB